MDIVGILLFVLAFVGSTWLTLYALWEFHLTRTEEFAETVRHAVQEEVHVRYLWPLLQEKMIHWVACCEHKLLDTNNAAATTVVPAIAPDPVDRVLCPNTRRLFCDLRRAMLLQPLEVEAFVCVCIDAVRGSVPLFTSNHRLRQWVRDECLGYPLQSGPFQGPGRGSTHAIPLLSPTL